VNLWTLTCGRQYSHKPIQTAHPYASATPAAAASACTAQPYACFGHRGAGAGASRNASIGASHGRFVLRIDEGALSFVTAIC
jgi:hypothetical protein